MKKFLLIGVLTALVAGCDKNAKCTSETCQQCAEACIVACNEEANTTDAKICKKTCQCTCVELENGSTLDEAFDKCL